MTEPVVLTGDALTLEDVLRVARHRAPVQLAPDAIARMERSRAVVERLLADRVKVYGLTTGFGSKKNVFIEPRETQQLQKNLIMSHSCGVGQPLDEDVVRATILLRANTLAKGLSGIRVSVVHALLDLLHLGIYPYVPDQGSLGASGDLAPLSHLALVLTGDPRGRIFNDARRPTATTTRNTLVERPEHGAFVDASPARLAEAGFHPVTLEAKEGLALTNGTQVMTAIGLLTVADARQLIVAAEGAAAMSFEALKGVLHAFDAKLHAARPHAGQSASAAALRAYTHDSQLLRLPLNMAWLNAATRSLDEARFHLRDQDAPLAEDIARNIGRSFDLLQKLRQAPEEALHTPGVSTLDAYRNTLEPVKTELLAIYRSLLGARLPGDAQMAQTAISNALASLEAAVPAMPSVQDSYSLRCAPQVLGAVRHTVEHVHDVLVCEATSATDNPLVFPVEHHPDGTPLPADDLDAYRAALTPELCLNAVRSGGNFHGEPVALVMDYLAIALCELGNIAERRVAHLVDGHLNNGLPSLLIHKAGLNSGFMIPQYTAAALVSENKSLAHPASVDSIPSCENTEDHVSMGTIAARKARSILINAEQVVAIELFTAYQALHFHLPVKGGVAAKAVTALLQHHDVRFVDTDRPLFVDIEQVAALVRTGAVTAALDAI